MTIQRTRFELRLSPEEKSILERRAQNAGMSPSAFMRACINSYKAPVIVIDITPLNRAVYELSRQGINLNQLVHLLNAYGVEAFDREAAEGVLEKERGVFDDLRGTLALLRGEARKHRVYIRKT